MNGKKCNVSLGCSQSDSISLFLHTYVYVRILFSKNYYTKYKISFCGAFRRIKGTVGLNVRFFTTDSKSNNVRRKKNLKI